MGFRGLVSNISVSFEWRATWQELINEVATHLEIPGDAIWQDVTPELKAEWMQIAADGDPAGPLLMKYATSEYGT